MAAFARLFQHIILHHKKQLPWITRRGMSEYKKFAKQEGIPLKWHRVVQQDYDISLGGFIKYLQRKAAKDFKKSQMYLPERHQILGPDLATAHFVVVRDGAVKFVGRESWFKKDKSENYFLPNRRVEGLYLEAIDCSNTDISYIGLDNFVDLKHLKYLNFSQCENVDDWFMDKLHQFEDNVEFLDVSGCKNITERGLACIHHLRKLQGLRIADMTHVDNLELTVLMLEELLPGCTVLGLDELSSVLSEDKASDSTLIIDLSSNSDIKDSNMTRTESAT